MSEDQPARVAPGQDEYEAWLRWIAAPGESLEPTWADLPPPDRAYWVMVEKENGRGDGIPSGNTG